MKTKTSLLRLFLILVLSLIVAASASANTVVLRVVDQNGQQIVGSQISVLSQTVGTGGSVLLPEGTHTFTVIPAAFGSSHASWLSRTESAEVTAATTEIAFEWITSAVTLRLQDQAAVEISGSRFTIPPFGVNVYTSGAVTLPITDEVVYPTLGGAFASGYDFDVEPFGHPASLVRRETHNEVTPTTTGFTFEWIRSDLMLRLQDQTGTPIAGSRFTVVSFGINVYTGGAVTLPITDEGIYPTLGGAFASGYEFDLEPFGHPASLVRRETQNEVTATTTGFTFEWIRSNFTLRMQDQTGTQIAGSRFTVVSFGINAYSGGAVTLPITDESVYPALVGSFASGYEFDLEPFGHPASLVRREANNEVTATTTGFIFEWIQHQCALEVRDINAQAVPGSTLVLPSPLPPHTPGDAVIFPVNDVASYPTVAGAFASGYAITVGPGNIAPTSAIIQFKMLASGAFTPASFVIRGNTYSLGCDVSGDQSPPQIVSCAADRILQSNADLQATVPDLRSEVVAEDNSTSMAQLLITQNPPAGAVIGLGNIGITLTVRDSAGNESSCVSNLSVFQTPPGGPVVVQPIEEVTIEFTSVTAGGTTTVTASTPGPPTEAPATFRFGQPPILYHVETDAEYSGTIELCFSYNDGDFRKESTLKLFHYENGDWVDVTTSLRTDLNLICGQVTSFSPFAVVEEVNYSPEITSVTGPLDPLVVNSTALMFVTFADANTVDNHTATFSWDDGTSNEPIPVSGGSAVASHQYTDPGVFRVEIVLTDEEGESAVGQFQYVVIYDPNGGFVTGGGWINSPLGAYAANPLLTGKASFGFVAKYQQGASVPTGQTEFQFKAGDLNFHSTSYDWLVVAGAKAKYKGAGEINGNGNYGFMLTAIDGQVNGGGGVDKFRLKIWDKNYGDVVVYDNQMGASDTADPATALGGGSIVIRKP